MKKKNIAILSIISILWMVSLGVLTGMSEDKETNGTKETAKINTQPTSNKNNEADKKELEKKGLLFTHEIKSSLKESGVDPDNPSDDDFKKLMGID